jgi:hypothetical protein
MDRSDRSKRESKPKMSGRGNRKTLNSRIIAGYDQSSRDHHHSVMNDSIMLDFSIPLDSSYKPRRKNKSTTRFTSGIVCGSFSEAVQVY